MNRYRRNKNKGFTLAELLIVVAITIILAAVGFIAIFQYQQNLKFTEMENDAREVFLAAQNSLTSMKENGVELQNNDQKMEDKLGKDNAPSDFDDAFKNAGMTGSASDYWKNNQSHFKYVSHKAGESVAKGSLLDQILDFGSVDETVRTDGSYIIEYDEDTYTVYGVFYSDYHGARSAVANNNADLSKYYIYLDTNRGNKENRKNFGKNNDNLGRLTTVGYYGAATDKDDTLAENLKRPQILIYNSGKITYKTHTSKTGKTTKSVRNTSEVINDSTYDKNDLADFSINDRNDLEKTLGDTLDLVIAKPDTGRNYYRIVVKVTGQDSHKSKKFNYYNKKNGTSSENKSFNDDNGYIYLNLDDVTDKKKSDGNNTHFAEIFDGFIPGENISVTVRFETKKGTASKSATLPANSLFDSVRTEKEKKDNKEVRTALIRSPRQLQNLEPTISDINDKKSDSIDTDKETNGVQSYTKISQVEITDNDIDWNWNGKTDNDNSARIYPYDKKDPVGDDTGKQFRSIYNKEITSFDGKGFSIIGLDAVDNEVKIDNDTTYNDAGLFAYASKDEKLTISNLTLSNVKATVQNGSGSAGGLIGEAEGDLTIEKVNVSASENSTITAKYTSAGSEAGDPKGSAGGLIGYSGSDKITLKDVKVASTDHSDGKSIVVYGPNKAGGVIGFLSTKDADISHVEYDGGSNGLVKADDRDAGGFIGRLVVNGKATIEDSYSTTYVYTNGNKLARAGGFIGYLNQTSGNSEINRCFYGGRTKDDGTYDDSDAPTDDFSKLKKGSWNVVNNDKSSEKDDHATAGGFLGTVSGKSKSVNVTDSYTTGSVYVGNGYVGGFVGQSGTSDERNESPLVLKYTYATGKVSSSSESSTKGTYIGRNIISNDSSNNYYLAGINSSDIKVAGSRNSETIDGIASSTSTNATGPFAVVENQKVGAVPYANLENKYPYKFVTQLENKISTLTQHVGDWPIVKPGESNYAVDNGNKLTFHIALPEDTTDFTMAVQGLANIGTSPRVVYAPFHIVRDGSGNISSIQWVNFFNSQWFNWPDGWKQYDRVTTCQIAHVESAQSFNAAYEHTNGSGYSSDKKEIYLAIDLDDLSKNVQYEAGPFVSLFTRDNRSVKLYPGEDICVRIKQGIEKFDISTDQGITANSNYDDGSNGTGDGINAHTALIANSRHLENLNMNLSGIDQYHVDQVKYTKAKQTNDIIWNDNDSSTNDYVTDIKNRNGDNSVTTYWWNGDVASSQNSFYPVYNTDLTEYDGNGKTIKNILVDMNVTKLRGNEPAATFQEIEKGGNIHDLTMENVNVSSPSSGSINAAGLIGTGNDLTLKNITISGNSSITVSDYGVAGGIVSEIKGTSVLDNCVINGSNVQIVSTQREAGGLIGTASDNVTIKNSKINGNNTSISSAASSGGLVGSSNGATTITDSTVRGNINIVSAMNNGHGSSGGAIGNVASGTAEITNTLVEGKNAVISASGTYDDLAAGGLVGTTKGGTKLSISNSAASAYMIGQNDAGGLVGTAGGTTSIEKSYSGGHTSDKAYQDILDNTNSGRYNVVAQNGYAGGLVGNNKGTLSYDKVFSASSVKAQNKAAGGIFGHSATTNVKDDAISYVIGLVSGKDSDNTWAYTGEADNKFNLGDAYYLPDLYVKRNIDISKLKVADESKASGSVADAYFDVENSKEQESKGRKGVAAKNSEDIATTTSVYDSALNGYEYPFKVWTNFNYADLKGKAYVGDWEPANLKTADAVNVKFKYQNPENGNLEEISGAYGTQKITVGKKTTVILPQVPTFSVADNNGVSYEPDGWYLADDNNNVTDQKVAEGTDSTASLQQNEPKEMTVVMKYKQSADKQYGITFKITDPDNTSNVQTVNKLVKSGDSVEAPDKEFNGYQFTGWYEGDNRIDNSAFSQVTRNMTVDAKYQKIEKFTVTVQFMRKDNNTIEQLSQQPYVLTGIKGEELDQDVTLPSEISNLKAEMNTAEVISGDAKVSGPTEESNQTRIHITASEDSIINVIYTGSIKADGKYTIQHIFEDTSASSNYEQGSLAYKPGSEYVYSVSAEQDKGLATGANAFDVTGFEAEPFTQEIVKSDKEDETVVKIHYKRRSHNVIYRSNGGTYIAPATFVYGQKITDPASPERTGYDFTGWTYTCRYSKDANGNNTVVSAGSAMPDEDVIATAGWKGKQTSYRVIYWLENANDDKYSPDMGNTVTKNGITGDPATLSDDDKAMDKFEGFTYDHDDSNVKTIRGNGSTVVDVYYKRNKYTVTFYSNYNQRQLKQAGNVVREVNSDDQWTYFTISQKVSIPAHQVSDYSWSYTNAGNGRGDFIRQTNGWGYPTYYYVGNNKGNYRLRNNSQRTTVPEQTYDSSKQYNDRSLLYYLQYNPDLAEVHYYQQTTAYVLQGTNPINSLTIQAKYGADITALWPGNRTDIDQQYRISKWYTVTDYENNYGTYSPRISQSGLTTMPLNGAEFIYEEERGNNTFESIFHGENIDGTDYDVIHTDSFRSDNTGWTTTKEDHYDLAGFTYDSSDNRNSREGSQPVWNNQTNTYQWNFYYKRNEYNISFNNGGTQISSEKIKYQADISQKGNEAQEKLKAPGNGYTFAGWYENAELQGDPYDFTDKKMPAGDLVLFAKWIPPVHSVSFDLNAPTGLTGTAPASLTNIDDGDSIEDQMIQQGNLTDAYTPKLLNSDGSANTEYNFTGWYTDAECKKPFVFASEIHADTTLYAGWEHVAGKRNITVNYIYRYTENGKTTEQSLGKDTVTGEIGQPLTINAKMDVGGYYPQQAQRNVIVESEDANPDQSVTFYYNKYQFNWQYQIRYYVLYDNGQKKALVSTSEKRDPTNYQMQVVYGSDEAPVPDSLKNYYVVGNNVQTVNAEHADDNNLVTVEFDLESDTSLIHLEDNEFTYNGEGHELKLNQNYGSVDASDDKKITYSLKTEYGYRRKDGSYEYKSDQPVDAGIYPVRGTLSKTITDGDSKDTEIIWKSDDSNPAYLTVARRTIVLESETIKGKPSGKTIYSNAGTDNELNNAIKMKEGTWIVTDSNGKKTGESSQTSYGIEEVQFAANAYRLDTGEAVNAFDYEINKDHIKETNYDIQKVYGKLILE